jgi:hypothetical protein
VYCTTDYLTLKFAGRFNFGTSGTCLMGTAQAQAIIDTMTNYIDMELTDFYGTVSPLFGTNAYGTGTIPLVIKDICSDLSMGMMFQNTVLTITEKQNTWAQEIYGRGTEWLGKLKSGEWYVSEFKGTNLTSTPLVSGGETSVFGEILSLNNTDMVALNNRTVIDNSVIVYGTQALNPPVYRRYIDYNYWAYGKEKQGTNYGYIQSTGTGSITGNFPVVVDYLYKKFPNFCLNDDEKWGLTEREKR